MLEKLRDELKRGRIYPCATRAFYETLNDADKEILMDLLGDSSVTHNGLSRALLEQTGVKIADTSIARHRSGLCSCSRI